MANPKDKIIFALDVEHFAEAQRWVNLLKDHVGIFKVGKQLFTHAGPKVIDMIRQKGQKVFLDLKYHDIPNTVAKAGEEATKLNVTMFNLHALGGFEMMKKTVEASRAMAKSLGIPKPIILAVTILTSMDEGTLKEVGIQGPLFEEVGRLASPVFQGRSGWSHCLPSRDRDHSGAMRRKISHCHSGHPCSFR